jgi:dTDP-glucose pyrophosphorylase
MLQIVVPMAGRGSRFANAGFTLPKPLIPVHGVPMIQLVVENLRPRQEHRFIFLCLEEHIHRYPVRQLLRQVAPNCEIVPVQGVTQGAACTVLLAHEHINTDEPLMIANSDQWVDVCVDDYLSLFDESDISGLIMTMEANDPKWSFVRLNERGAVVEVVEKKVVSNEATVGIYNFRCGRDFVAAAESMILQDLRVNNEFYVAPTYNCLIADGKKIQYKNIGRERDGMYGLGIPEDLAYFVASEAGEKALLPFRARSTGRAAA